MSKTNKNIILIKPDTDLGKKVHPPLSIMYLGSALKKKGFNPELIHCSKKEIGKTAKKILNAAPLLVALSVITGPETLYAAQISKKIKKESDIPILWGGIHPTLLTEQCIKEDYIDYVCIGEGEETICELASALQKKQSLKSIKGLAYKNKKKITISERRPLIKDLDKYRIDFDIFDLKPYLRKASTFKRSISYMTSRGCPHSCNFCYNQIFNNSQWRPFSEKIVLEDIEYLKSKYNIDAIYFWDDNFYPNKKRAFNILEKIGIPAYTEIRIDYLNKNICEKLKKVHSDTLLIGAESGSDKTLKLINKGFTAAKLKQGIDLLEKYDLGANYSFILGLPTETKKEMYKTIDMMRYIFRNHKKGSITLGAYIPYPGTKLYRLAIKQGFNPPKRTEDWRIMDRWYDHIKYPWVDTTFIKRLRGYFLYAKTGIPPFKNIFNYRIDHNIFSSPVDIDLYLKLVDNPHLTRKKLKSLPILGRLYKKY